MNEFFKISDTLKKQVAQTELDISPIFAKIDTIAEYNAHKVMKAFHDNNVSEQHFQGSTGYGYGDRGRETLDFVFAQIVGAEDALVRHNFVSGTHALTTALFGILRTGDTMLSVTGKPYDTLEEVIGLRGNGKGSLKDFGIHYAQLELLADGLPNYEEISKQAPHVKVIYLQRSRGYALRPCLFISEIEKIIQCAKKANPNVIVMVDNCYGEFVEKQEPTHVDADLIVGSLIKNPGGGIAQTGGYIAGKKHLVELCSYRLTCPGMGKEVGCTLGESKSMFMGLFLAPTVVANAIKTAVFSARLLELMGYAVYPKFDEQRSDIIQVIKIGNKKRLIDFCVGIQKGSPVDSFVAPEPWDMPGYDVPVIMAAGTFTMGASIELSADAPMREPYCVWLQGGITYSSGKLGIILAAQNMQR
ncbi:MAG: methionine gamma-lyase family protein [Oscillospiraceae bacterium]